MRSLRAKRKIFNVSFYLLSSLSTVHKQSLFFNRQYPYIAYVADQCIAFQQLACNFNFEEMHYMKLVYVRNTR